MIRDGYDLRFVIVVLWMLFSYRFVNRHMCSVLLIVWYCNLLSERLKVFCFLMKKLFQKILQKVCVLRLLICFTCVCIAHVL